nr:ATP-grasp domain-containing protein [Pseudactinotalea sp. HY160]
MPGQHVARLEASGITPSLWTPDPGLIANLPAEVTGRTIHVCTLADLADGTAGNTMGGIIGADRQERAFMKPADHKIPGLPAGKWTLPEFVAAARAARFPAGGLVLVSGIVHFTAEYRVFVLDGEPVAASGYLIDGHTWDEWDPGDLPDTGEAITFARRVLTLSADLPVPRGWVLDVGLTTGGSWAVVEANPAWSSNPYWATEAGVNRAGTAEPGAGAVVETILAAQVAGNQGAGARWLPLRAGRALPVRS